MLLVLTVVTACAFGLVACHGGPHRQNLLTSDADIDANVPTSGTLYSALQTECNSSVTLPDSQSAAENAWQDTKADTNILACAVLAVRLDEGVNNTLAATYRDRAFDGLDAYASDGPANVKVLGTARTMPPLVAAADLLDHYTTTLMSTFNSQLTNTHGIGVCSSTLVGVAHCSGENWGDNARASVTAIKLFLNAPDSPYDYGNDLIVEAAIFNEYVGENTTGPVSLNYDDGAPWRPSGSDPRGINGVGTVCSGNVNVNGVRSNDQARGGNPNCGTNTAGQVNENYAYGGFQGNVMQWVLMERAGLVEPDQGSDAINRALKWLYVLNNYPPEPDDAWMVPAVNHTLGITGTGFAYAEQPCDTGSPGKNMSCNVAKAIW